VNDTDQENSQRIGFLHSLGRLFGSAPLPAAPPSEPVASGGLEKLEVEFTAAITAMNKRIDEQRRAARSAHSTIAQVGTTPQDRVSERQRRKASCHRAMREDIEKMHAALQTGLTSSALDGIVEFLGELDAVSHVGRDSHVLLSRARHTIAKRLRSEAGELAVARLIATLQRHQMEWPDPRQHHRAATLEEIEESRRRRLTEARESFLAYDFERIAERVQGVVSGWGADYPDRGSPLWQESVLKGVGAGLWGRLLGDFIALLERDRLRLLSRTEESMCKEIAALHAALESRTGSITETTEAVANSLRVLDEVVPEIAWELVRAQLARAS
jgi:hypothetical protein